MARRKGKSPLLIGSFAFFILLLQVLPGIVLAQAPSLPVPQLNAPNYQMSDLQAPQWETPQLEAPQWETPQLEPPGWDTPQLQPPGGDPPPLHAPDGSVPALEPPGGEIPQLRPPNSTIPSLQMPAIELPASQSPGGGVKKLDPAPLKPPSPEPFGETKGYDALKLSFKDMIGGTLGYSAALIEQGEVDLRTGAGKYGGFLLQLGLKGIDIGVKDTPWGNVTGLTLDGLDAKGIYDGYQFILKQNPNALAGNVNAQRSFSNAVNAANTVRVPGIVTGLNVGIAAISLPFDVFDTVTKFDQAFDSSLSQDKQNEKFVDGVGSFGSTLIDAGIIASVIPGGQTVAGVLVVTGAVLWGLSRLVKWSDKLAGGAITRGIREGVSKAVGWVKSIFA
ncbi:hypothetical protein AN963_28145 [Brevibacillus choshinensis]|uniref:Uncharacterized protein n=1 Tax=Brevibacillus choshinensis TaxID=54911 RepID=A0ABR5N3T8_BRECH|nr:hypothetical protein [Brevibacillus choshinensis]KQL45167.1 hypothetical protein AN963_28145 [Brevibacillus choshinensis]